MEHLVLGLVLAALAADAGWRRQGDLRRWWADRHVTPAPPPELPPGATPHTHKWPPEPYIYDHRVRRFRCQVRGCGAVKNVPQRPGKVEAHGG